MADQVVNERRQELPRRILLLLTARTYRAQPFVDAAATMGIEVVKAVDMHRQLADYWRYPLGLEYSRLDEAVEAIVAFNDQRPLGAIMAVDDSGGDVAAAASNRLGLPHNSPAAAAAARNKHLMRQMMARAGVRSPSYWLTQLPADSPGSALAEFAERVAYPCVLKPINLSGSRGVMRADGPREFVSAGVRLHRLLNSIEPSDGPKSVLIESYVPGFEVALEGILDDGRLQVLALFDKPDPLEGPFFEETIYVTPSRLELAVQKEIVNCAAEAAAALGLSQGPVHAELRVNEKGAWIIEIAGRSIGGLCSETLRFGSGASLEELIVRQAFGMDITNFERETLSRGVMMIPIPEAGLLKRVVGCDEAARVPLVEKVEITARLNYSLKKLPEGDSYLGFIFARGPTPEAVEASLRQAHDCLNFEIAPELSLLPAASKLGP